MNHIGPRPRVKFGPQLDASFCRLYPNPIILFEAKISSRFRMHLYPALPGSAQVNRRLFEQPGLVSAATHRPAHETVGIEAEGKRSRLRGAKDRYRREKQQIFAVCRRPACSTNEFAFPSCFTALSTNCFNAVE